MNVDEGEWTSMKGVVTGFSAETACPLVIKGRASTNELSWFCCHALYEACASKLRFRGLDYRLFSRICPTCRITAVFIRSRRLQSDDTVHRTVWSSVELLDGTGTVTVRPYRLSVNIRHGAQPNWTVLCIIHSHSHSLTTVTHYYHVLYLSSTSSRLVSSEHFNLRYIYWIKYLYSSISSRSKQHERRERIKALAPMFHGPMSTKDHHVLGLPISKLTSEVQDGQRDPVDVLMAYGKRALEAHEETNCLTEVMIGAAIGWAKECNRTGPLAGVPVSLKDVSFVFPLRQRAPLIDSEY